MYTVPIFFNILSETPRYFMYRKNAICDNVGDKTGSHDQLSIDVCVERCSEKNYKWLYHKIDIENIGVQGVHVKGVCGCCYDPPVERIFSKARVVPGFVSNIYRLQIGIFFI